MKIRHLKAKMKYAWLMFGIVLLFSSCEEKDYIEIIQSSKDQVLVLDGMYLMGNGTALTTTQTAGKLKVAKNEALQKERPELYEMYVAVKAGAEGFNIVTVEGSETKSWGPGADFAEVPVESRHGDEPKNGSLQKGSIAETQTPFTVPEDGLYHVAYDTEINMISVARVKWGLIGAATPKGWSGDTELTATSFDVNSMTFEATGVEMIKGDFKIRYSGGWKIFLDEEYDLGEGKTGISVNTNFGGKVSALEAGGDNMTWTENGVYTVKFIWELGKPATISFEKTGDLEINYPETMYMIGEAVGGWDWSNIDQPMVPVHSHLNLFWKVIWLEGGKEFKFAPGKEWKGDFGMGADLGSGEYTKGGTNLVAPAESGYYMVVVDLEAEKISVVNPTVYLIGDAVGSWNAPNPDALFTVDNANEVLTISKTLAAANLRMYAWHPYFTDWWQSEFMVFGGAIEYRGTGNDQAAVPVEAGNYKIDLNFKSGTGTISKQ